MFMMSYLMFCLVYLIFFIFFFFFFFFFKQKTAYEMRISDWSSDVCSSDLKVAADGTLILLGSDASCINTGGEKVFPEEVEQVIAAHPCVEDCLVVGVPDERFGQRVTAILALIAGQTMTVSELDAFPRKSLTGYKLTLRRDVFESVTHSTTGKTA